MRNKDSAVFKAITFFILQIFCFSQSSPICLSEKSYQNDHLRKNNLSENTLVSPLITKMAEDNLGFILDYNFLDLGAKPDWEKGEIVFDENLLKQNIGGLMALMRKAKMKTTHYFREKLLKISSVSHFVHGLYYDAIIRGEIEDLKGYIEDRKTDFDIGEGFKIIKAEVVGDRIYLKMDINGNRISMLMGYPTKHTVYEKDGKRIYHFEKWGNALSLVNYQPISPWVEEYIKEAHKNGDMVMRDFSGWFSPEVLAEENYRYFAHSIIDDNRSDTEILKVNNGALLHLNNGNRILVHFRGVSQDQLFPDLSAKADNGKLYWYGRYFSFFEASIDEGFDAFRIDLMHELHPPGDAGDFSLIKKVCFDAVKYARSNGKRVWFLLETYDEHRDIFRAWNKELDYPAFKPYYKNLMDDIAKRNIDGLNWSMDYLINNHEGALAETAFLSNYDEMSLRDMVPNEGLRRKLLRQFIVLGKAGYNIMMSPRELLEFSGEFVPKPGGERDGAGKYITHKFHTDDELRKLEEFTIPELLEGSFAYRVMEQTGRIRNITLRNGRMIVYSDNGKQILPVSFAAPNVSTDKIAFPLNVGPFFLDAEKFIECETVEPDSLGLFTIQTLKEAVKQDKLPNGLSRLLEGVMQDKIILRDLDVERTYADGQFSIAITPYTTAIEAEGGKYYRALADFELNPGILRLHPVFLNPPENLKPILKLAFIKSLWEVLGYSMANENLAYLVKDNYNNIERSVEEVFVGNAQGIIAADKWIRDFVRIKFNWMILANDITDIDIYNWYMKNRSNPAFAQAFTERLHELLYHNRSEYRWTAARIFAQPGFNAGVDNTGFGDNSLPNALMYLRLPEKAVELAVNTFYTKDAQDQKRMMHILAGIIEKENNVYLKQQAKNVLERIFDVMPLNAYRYGENVNDNIERTKAGDEGQTTFTKKEPLLFRMECSKDVRFDFDVSFVIKSNRRNHRIEELKIPGIEKKIIEEKYLYSEVVDTALFNEVIDAEIMIRIDGKEITVARRHYRETLKDVTGAKNYKIITYEPIEELIGKNIVVATAEMQIDPLRLPEIISGGLGILESSALKALPWTGANIHFMLPLYEWGWTQVIDENGHPKQEWKCIKDEYLDLIKDYSEGSRVFEIQLGVKDNPQARRMHYIKAHKLKIPIKEKKGLFAYVYVFESLDKVSLYSNIYPGEAYSEEREYQMIAFAHCVNQAMLDFKIKPDVVQSHESFAGLVPFIRYNHPDFRYQKLFEKTADTNFSHSMIAATVPSYSPENNWMFGLDDVPNVDWNKLLRNGGVDPFLGAGRYSKKTGVLCDEHKEVMINKTYPELKEQYEIVTDSIYIYDWAMPEIIENGFELFNGVGLWNLKQKKALELIDVIVEQTKGTKGEITRDMILSRVETRTGEKAILIPPIFGDGIRRWLDYKNNIYLDKIPGRNGLSGYEYLCAPLMDGGVELFLIKGGFPHIKNDLGKAWMQKLKTEIMPNANNRIALYPYTQKTARLLWAGTFGNITASLPPLEAYGMAFMKVLLNYGINIGPFTGGFIDKIIDVQLHPEEGNGYIFMPYSPEAMQEKIEDAAARYYAYFCYINDVEPASFMKNEYLRNKVEGYIENDPEGVIRIMRNAAAMAFKVDARRSSMVMAKNIWLSAIRAKQNNLSRIRGFLRIPQKEIERSL